VDEGTSISSSTFPQPPQVKTHDTEALRVPDQLLELRPRLYERKKSAMQGIVWTVRIKATGMSMSAQEVGNDR